MISEKNPAQSEVLGVVLILGITVTGMAIILVSGTPVLNDVKENAEAANAINAFTLLDERISSASLSGSERKEVDMNLNAGKLQIFPDKGTLRIYSPILVNATDARPGVTSPFHVLEYAIGSGSPLVGDNLDTVKISYENDSVGGGTEYFDNIDGDDSKVYAGFDTDSDGRVEEYVHYQAAGIDNLDNSDVVASIPDEQTLRLEFDSGISLDKNDILKIWLQDVKNPKKIGDYEAGVSVNGRRKQDPLRIGYDVTVPSINQTVHLGKIRYEVGNRIITYQNGGVWSKIAEGESTTRSVPEIHYDGSTLTMSMINVDIRGDKNEVPGDNVDTLAGGIPKLLVEKRSTQRLYPRPWEGKSNPVSGVVYVTVRSSVYNGWARYFRSTTSGDAVEVNDTTNTVQVQFRPLPDAQFNQALLSTNGGTVIKNSTVDAYNSDLFDYSPKYRIGAGNVISEGNVSVLNTTGANVNLSAVYGNVRTNGTFRMQVRTRINGTVRANGVPDLPPSSNNVTVRANGSMCPVRGQITAPPVISTPAKCTTLGRVNINTDTDVSVPRLDTVNRRIAEKISEFKSKGYPHPEDVDPSGSPYEIPSGNYLVNSTRDWTNDNVDYRFDTTEGPVQIAIDNGATFDLGGPGDVTINVTGSHPVQIFRGNWSAGGPGPGGIEAVDLNAIEMNVENNRTDLFEIYVNASTSTHENIVDIEQNTEFYGTIYAPTYSGYTKKNIDIKDSTIYGSVIGGNITVRNSEVHYDRSLLTPQASGTRINFLHITDNVVRVR